jgi:hypothetical protein
MDQNLYSREETLEFLPPLILEEEADGYCLFGFTAILGASSGH